MKKTQPDEHSGTLLADYLRKYYNYFPLQLDPSDQRPIFGNLETPSRQDSAVPNPFDKNSKERSNDCFNQYCVVQTEELFQAKFGKYTIQFCKDCIKHYELQHCCYYCGQVYSDDDQTFLDGKDWIQCDLQGCKKWMHIDCEAKDNKQIYQLAHNINFRYQCPWCRLKKNTPIIKKDRQYKPRGKPKSEYLHYHKEQYHESEIMIEELNGGGHHRFCKSNKNKEQNTKSSETNRNHSDEPQIKKKVQFDPIMSKNTFLDELLKKFGGYSSQVSQEDTISDLVRISSIISMKKENQP